jgi:DNA ligase-1
MNKTFYGKDKGGKYKVWQIQVEHVNCDQPEAILTITHGQEGGKMTVKPESITKGKQGRTPYEQAVSEAEGRIKKQVDKGYREDKVELENLPVLAMLSKDHTKDGKEETIEDGVFISDKLDGVRCLAKCKLVGGVKVVTLESRTGQPYDVPHIVEELLNIMEPGDILDGELYVHGPSLQEITSAVKRTDPEKKIAAAYKKMQKACGGDGYEDAEAEYAEAIMIESLRNDLEFHVFDLVVMDTPFEERLEMLTEYSSSRFLNDIASYVIMVPYQYVDNLADLTTQLKWCIERGYEGVMYRTKGGLYESGKRSTGLWKFKLFMDSEFLILDVEPRKDDGSAFSVQNDLNDKTFSVTLGSMNERAEFLANKELYIGKLITVQYQARYKDTLLPQFPTGKAIRDYE